MRPIAIRCVNPEILGAVKIQRRACVLRPRIIPRPVTCSVRVETAALPSRWKIHMNVRNARRSKGVRGTWSGTDSCAPVRPTKCGDKHPTLASVRRAHRGIRLPTNACRHALRVRCVSTACARVLLHSCKQATLAVSRRAAMVSMDRPEERNVTMEIQRVMTAVHQLAKWNGVATASNKRMNNAMPGQGTAIQAVVRAHAKPIFAEMGTAVSIVIPSKNAMPDLTTDQTSAVPIPADVRSVETARVRN